MRQMRQKRDGVDGDADEPLSLDVGRGLGAANAFNENSETNFVFSQELEKWENKAVLSPCLVKRKLLKEYNNTN